MIDFTPTNTLASANFDILKMDGVEDPLININTLATLDFQESYFADAVKFINEQREAFTKAKIVLYRGIHEASNETVILESFSDFFVKVKEIIDKFLKFIKSIFDRFLTTLNRMIGSEKFLVKHKKDLMNFKDADKFDIDGYKYSFDENIPLPEAALSYNHSLFDSLYGDANRDLNVLGVKAAITAMDLEADYSAFRGKVIGHDGVSISITDFSDELFAQFRSGESTTETIEIDFAEVRKAADRFFSFDKTKKTVERCYKRVESSYKEVEKQVKELTKRNSDLSAKEFIAKLPDSTMITSIDGKSGEALGTPMSAELMTQIDIYMKAKIEQIQEYSNIHILAFGAKLDALKSCTIQDKSILYTALTRIQRPESKRKEY